MPWLCHSDLVPLLRTLRLSVLAALVPATMFAASPMQQVWEVDLPQGEASELAFSPDGKKLAVSMDGHLFIVDVDNPHAPLRQIDLDGCGQSLAWAPDGNALLACNLVVRLEDGNWCDLLPAGSARSLFGSYWLSNDRIIRRDRTITDLSCRAVDRWETSGNWPVEGRWFVAGTVPEKGWMLMRQTLLRTINHKTLPFSNYAIADRRSHLLTSGTLLPDGYEGANPIIATGAAAVCSPVTRIGGYKSSLSCWNLPDGHAVPVSSSLERYGVAQVSLNSPRVIAEHWGPHWWELFYEAPELLDRAVVDLRSGVRLATLQPRPQDGARVRWALSPDGRYLAEGAAGKLRLYRLP